MKIIDSLLSSVETDAAIQRVLVGAHWSAVSSQYCGMASTVISDKPHGAEAVRGAGDLHLKSAKELAQYLLSENWLEASIGLAALNSLIEPPSGKLTHVNAFKVITEKGRGKHVAIFGHFPYMDEVRASARKVSVFELHPGRDELSLLEMPQILPDADIAAITSNTLINHTLESILPYIQPGAYTALVGASTPISEVCFDAGFDLLAGVRVLDEDAVFTSIAQGANFRQVRGLELITLSRS